MLIIECLKCNKKISISPSRLKRKKYCSKRCLYIATSERVQTEEEKTKRAQSNTGKKRTPEQRLKLSKIQKERFLDPLAREKLRLSWTKERKEKERLRMLGNKITVGYKHTQEWLDEAQKRMSSFKHTSETKKKISRIKLGKPQWHRKGELSPWWRGGITPLYIQIRGCPNYKLWRADVFERDKFTCQECQASGCELNADHVKPFSKIIQENNIKTFEQALKCEELWDINNGRALCVPCHRQTDTYMGRAKKFLVANLNQ